MNPSSGGPGRNVLTDCEWRHAISVLKLTDHEAEIVKRVFDNQRGREIANELGVSCNTLRGSMKRILQKVGADSRISLVVSVVDVARTNKK